MILYLPALISISLTIWILGLGFYRYSFLGREHKILLALLLASLISDVVSSIMGLKAISNLHIINVYAAVELLLLLLVYKTVFTHLKSDILFNILIIFSLVLWVLDWLLNDGVNKILSVTFVYKSFLMLMFSMYYYYVLIRDLETESIYDNPMFWFNTGVLVYFSGNLFVFSFSNFIVNLQSISIWQIHNGLHLFYLLGFAFAFWKSKT